MVKRRFKVLAGFHKDKKGVVHGKNEVVSSKHDLATAWPNKFQELGSEPGTVKQKKKKKKGKLGALLDKKKGGVKGEDVTKKFPIALRKSLRVLRNEDGKLNVVKSSDKATPLNPKPLVRQRVERFIDEFEEEEAED